MRKNSKVFKNTASEWLLYRRFFLLVASIVLVLLLTYFVGLTILGSLGTREETFTERDRIAPPPPLFASVPEATNSAKLSLKGFAEPGSTVKLFLNRNEKDSQLVSAEGQFAFEKVDLELGENEIYAVSKDTAGNESQPSVVYKVEIDQKPPKLEVSEPENGAMIKEEKDKQTFVLVKGKVEEKATVTVNDYQAIVKEGEFEYQLLLTKDGENTIKIEAKDRAGNKTTVEKTVIYKKLEASKGES